MVSLGGAAALGKTEAANRSLCTRKRELYIHEIVHVHRLGIVTALGVLCCFAMLFV